ncbi:MAG TPA: hypothetical protein VK506_10985 [Conexibacter sp.]|nr:hypothetical protein [Conexibacter sp.]
MPNQGTSTPTYEDAVVDGEIMRMLLADDGQRPWTVAEIARETGDEIAVTDSLSRLHGGGLIHRLEGFVFATRAALASEQLAR